MTDKYTDLLENGTILRTIEVTPSAHGRYFHTKMTFKYKHINKDGSHKWLTHKQFITQKRKEQNA
jgi:hypothetical protein